MYKNFRNLLLDIHQKSLSEQKQILYAELKEWQGDVEQIDDVLIIGLKV